MTPTSPPPPARVVDRARAQRRTVRTLVCAQVFSALGNGSTLSLGSILAVDLSGSDAWAGSVTTAVTLGTALFAMPLSQVALRRGRRVALAAALGVAVLGTAGMVAAVVTRSFVVLLLAALCIGLAAAANLQARFAVTDLASPQRRGRELSFVVWAITVGAVLGPNTVRPGAALAGVLHLPPLAGPFVISAAGMVIGAAIVVVGLRPDPLLTRLRLDADEQAAPPSAPRRGVHLWVDGWRVVAAHPTALAAVAAVVAAHAVMVAVMSMTPLHMQHAAGAHAHDSATVSLIGLTISLHIAGMYALSPVMGWASDRFGPRTVALAGLALLLGAVAVTGIGAHTMGVVTVGLVLIGLGWSAATVSGSTLLVSALRPADRVPAQGFSDAAMSLSGALAAAVAGPVMGGIGYAGISALAAVIALVAAGTVGTLTRAPARA